ncbi:hypothetical protein BLNAU_13622 [Blattamonas nauphoetae]|uniref:PRA1 family protein n=1 Tax=Blattamonas nauphoetae TaxID=2049346 RepID=A0ABQ9XJT1_9EUKA|nr:hypothetical protein BLNAU_13622 [Blattamonas nauphoetae]
MRTANRIDPTRKSKEEKESDGIQTEDMFERVFVFGTSQDTFHRNERLLSSHSDALFPTSLLFALPIICVISIILSLISNSVELSPALSKILTSSLHFRSTLNNVLINPSSNTVTTASGATIPFKTSFHHLERASQATSIDISVVVIFLVLFASMFGYVVRGAIILLGGVLCSPMIHPFWFKSSWTGDTGNMNKVGTYLPSV